PRAEVVERPADGERRRGEDGRAAPGVDAVPQQRADVDGRRAQEEVLRPRDLAEPVDAVVVWLDQRLLEHGESRLEAAADHLQLADPLVGLLAAEPLAHAPDTLAQRRGEGGERCRPALARQPDLGPTTALPGARRSAGC